MNVLIALLGCLWLGVGLAMAGPVRTWDFEHGATGWQEPGGSGVVAEPDKPGNHAYQIVATKPHHTQLILSGSEASPDFVASVRFKVISSEGEPPAVYVYGRLGQGGFRGLSVSGGKARGFGYYGQDRPSADFGSVSVDARKKWVHVKLACYKSHLFAKAWLEGEPEPRWRISGESGAHEQGRFA
ncbi:MAG: hypothetical protein FJ279_18570, partial [Planctomycetes bacterium]|nr:hypothetical protein [Planctomycetota bacterium]